MAVATLTKFPLSIIAGDTLRATISDSRYPSTLWTLSVQFESPTTVLPFAATTGTGISFNLVIAKTATAVIPPGEYNVRYIFTETSSSERQTGDCFQQVQVYQDPTVVFPKTQARQALEAMQAAYLKLSSGANSSVNFNGQSFTRHNMKEFNDQIEMQKAVVDAEDFARMGGPRGRNRIVHPL